MKGFLKKRSLTGKQVEDFRFKNSKNPLLPWRTKQKNHKTPKSKIELEPIQAGGKIEAKLKEAFRLELLELCKTRTKKSNPDLLNFYVNSHGHDMANDAGTATTYRRNFKAPRLQKSNKTKGLSENMGYNGETVWNFQSKQL